jgi:lysophospholipase L1-like esterase
LLALLLLTGAWAGSPDVSGSQSSPLYLALGDSLAAGVGASEPAQTGYVGLVFDALQTEPTSPYGEGELILLNLGDPGETTTSMLASGGQMEKAVAEIESRRDDGTAGNEAAVITIDIGANDFIPLVMGDSPCLPNPLAEACQEAATSALTTFRSNFADIMRRLRAAAGSDVEIVAVGLYNPLSGSGGPFDAVGDAAIELFNRTVAEAAAEPAIQARLADVFPLFQDRGSELTHVAELPPDVHPNDGGHYLMAQVVVTALGLPAGAVATPPSGAPPAAAASPTPSPRPATSPPAASPTATVRALPAAGGHGDNDTPWGLYVGLIVAGVVVVAGGLLVLVRRRR